MLVALLGLHSPTIAFHADADVEDVSMARRNEEPQVEGGQRQAGGPV